MSRVDVIVPCYNYGRFLRECVESVLTQTGVDVRVLILDDCSPDNTEEIGRKLAAEDCRVEYRRHSSNLGHIATYNEGLEWVGGDYCLLLSADDALTPGSLARAAAVFEKHPEVVLTFGCAITTAIPEPATFRLSGTGTWKVMTGPEFVAASCRRVNNIVPTPTAVARTDVHRRIGGYRPDLPYTGDLELWLRFAAHGSIGEIDADQAYYRTHGANMTKEYYGTRVIRQYHHAFDAYFSKFGEQLNEADQWQSFVYKALATEACGEASRALESRDLPTYRECRALARELDPSVWRRPLWWRLVGKRVAPSWVRHAYRRVLGRPSRNSLPMCTS